MTGGTEGERSAEVVVGATIFTARALQQLALGIARDAARVSTRDVRVQLSDDGGALRIDVTVPVAMASSRGTTVIETGDALRAELIDRMRRLADREVRTVNVRYSGVRRNTEKRVR
ncbi:hypothetical protein [Microbacterium algeriense]|jgi:hypothetical protein|uniref:hypothetical protein n=1 Tax=Microbacterium algeriense TaxID=2615184 RepID=UPI0022E78AE3|nr:hypothetical protein [Microbacterium algeriense]